MLSSLTEQTFTTDILRKPNNAVILQRWQALELPDAWLVASCLFQTVWNGISNQAPDTDIKDYDIFILVSPTHN